MSRRIEIELTSARPDGVLTWRAAGAREPRGTVDPSVLPDGIKVGDVLKVDADIEVDGITILGVAGLARARKEPTRIELVTNDRPFEPVTQTLARRERGDRDRGDRGDRPRRDRPARDSAGRDGARPDRPRGDRPVHDGDRPARRDDRPARDGAGPRRDRPARPRFEPVPELPQRPRATRLKPGRAHRSAVLDDLPEAQRAIAEKALQGGIPAVRMAVQEQNTQLKAQGKEEIPAAGLLKMAEELLPRLRVAEWLDRADAAKADIDRLDLRDLRSVVAASDDPMITRDETSRELANELKAALISRQDQASAEWIDDIGMAVDFGRVIRALKLSSEPPKAGMRFPADLAAKLSPAATAALASDALPERWSAVLEAAAFSPIRAQVTPVAGPATTNDELTATMTRLASLLPQIAALFGITPVPGAQSPKPLRAPRKPEPRKPGTSPAGRPDGGRPPRPTPAAAPATAASAPLEVTSADSAATPDETAPMAAEPTTVEAVEPILPDEITPDEITPDSVVEPIEEAADSVVDSIEQAPDDVVTVADAAADDIVTIDAPSGDAPSDDAPSEGAADLES